jgi:hypothetical protein
MLSRARTAVAARIAATLVVVSLSGAPRVLAVQAPVERHRCTCGMGGAGRHVCNCPLCKLAKLSRGSGGSSQGEPAAGGLGGHCIEGTCGDGHRFLAPTAVEPFYLPAGPAIAFAADGQTRPLRVRGVLSRSQEPETPPPRPA